MILNINLLPATLPLPGEAVEEAPTPDVEHGPPDTDNPYIVVVYNDDWHTFEQVERQLQKATACTLEKAEALAMEIHTQGRAVVFSGSHAECERVANVLREIRLQVETDRA